MRGHPRRPKGAITYTPPFTYKAFTGQNVVFYDGPSQLDGTPIVVVATARNANRKIGEMVQLWVMLRDISPIEAVRTGQDAAVCGHCPLRGDGAGNGRSCYVEYWRSVNNIWQALPKARRMSPAAFAELVRGKQLRIAAYGNPDAVPYGDVWAHVLPVAAGWTSYTHRWQQAPPEFRSFSMASVSSPHERDAARAAGWRTYRVRHVDEPVLPGEVVCPASHEGGQRVQCANCELCRGTSLAAKDIVIVGHGQHVVHLPVAAGFVPMRAVRRSREVSVGHP